MSLIDQLSVLERSLHDPELRRDPLRVSALLAPDFTEIGASGRVYDRAAILSDLAAETSRDFQVESDRYALQPVGEDAALLTYRSFHRLPDGNCCRYVLRSSLWQRIDGRWRMRFHQGTPAAG